MTTAQMVKQFFKDIEEIWDSIPGYVKVFLYAFISSAFALWIAGDLDWRQVVIIVATNLGLYQVPRTIGTQTKKLL